MRAEREVIQLALAKSHGVMSKAAKLLGISRPTLYGLLETHGLASAAALEAEMEPGGDA